MKNFFLVLLHYNFIQIKVKTKKINDSPASEYKGLEVIECLLEHKQKNMQEKGKWYIFTDFFKIHT